MTEKRELSIFFQNEAFRFIPIDPNSVDGKSPTSDCLWMQRKETDRRRYNDPVIVNHLKNGGNVAIVLGHGNLRAIDVDSQAFIKLFEEKNINTLTIRTPSGGLHLYFISDFEIEAKYKTLIFEGKQVGEFRHHDCYCLIPPSICEVKPHE